MSLSGMASHGMYDPPRANRTQGFWRVFWRLRGAFERARPNGGRATGTFYPSLWNFLVLARSTVPGRSLTEVGWPVLGRIAFYTWLSLGVIFVVFLGEALSTLAFSFMMSIHASSAIHLLGRIYPQRALARRIALSLAVVFLFGGIVYPVGLRVLEALVAMPVRVGNEIYVVNTSGPGRQVGVGDVVIYRLQTQLHGVLLREGYGLDRILAAPGDEVCFGEDQFTVNGIPFRRLEGMPVSGKRVVPSGEWFIWPSASFLPGNPHDPGSDALRAVEKVKLALAVVPSDRIVGKPYEFWLWRPQIR